MTGVDLTAEYVRIAETLSERVGLGHQVSYRQGSALALPFDPGTFDGAYMLHVGMNIEDKRKLFGEARRVLKLGGIFGIYDVMREGGESGLRFPVPWAASAETSFLGSAATYQQLLEGADFSVQSVRSRREFAIEFFNQMRARAAQSGGPPAPGPAYPDGGICTAEGRKYDRQPRTRTDRAHGDHLPDEIGSPALHRARRNRDRADHGGQHSEQPQPGRIGRAAAARDGRRLRQGSRVPCDRSGDYVTGVVIPIDGGLVRG